MRSPLTETIKRVQGMIAYVRENLDEGEYDLFLDLILPEPEPVKAAKKRRKKGSKGGSKSARAQSLSGAIQRTPKSKTDDGGDEFPDLLGGHEPCAFKYAHGEECQAAIDANIHHMKNMTGYHPFVSTAQPARERSSMNGGATSGIASSEAEKENVSTATGG